MLESVFRSIVLDHIIEVIILDQCFSLSDLLFSLFLCSLLSVLTPGILRRLRFENSAEIDGDHGLERLRG